jgi:hypothetical protein
MRKNSPAAGSGQDSYTEKWQPGRNYNSLYGIVRLGSGGEQMVRSSHKFFL